VLHCSGYPAVSTVRRLSEEVLSSIGALQLIACPFLGRSFLCMVMGITQ
jgi:hypothetical protein